VKKSYLGTPVAEKRNDVLPHPAPLAAVADEIKFFQKIEPILLFPG